MGHNRKHLFLGHFLLSVDDEKFKTFWTSKYNCIGGTKKEWVEMKTRANKLKIKR